MADDENEEKNDGEEGEEGEESTFSKVGGMFGGGGDDEEEEEDEDTKKAKSTATKAAMKTMFDIAALKEFGLSVLTLFIETIIISVICVNILFFCAPESIRMNSLNLEKLFPTDRHKWPYCYTNEYTSCDADCEDKFGGIADDPKLSSAKKIYLKAAIILDTYIFKWFWSLNPLNLYGFWGVCCPREGITTVADGQSLEQRACRLWLKSS